MPHLRETLITEAERARICVSIGDRLSKKYEEKLDAKNNKDYLPQPKKNKLEKKKNDSESLLKQNKQAIKIDDCSSKKNETNIIITTTQTNNSDENEMIDSISLINKTIEVNINNNSTTKIKVGSNEVENSVNLISLSEKILPQNKSTKLENNNSTDQTLVNLESSNKIINESDINKVNKLSQKVAQLEYIDIADVFETNDNNQKNITNPITFSSTSLENNSDKVIEKKSETVNLKPLATAVLKSRFHAVTFKPFLTQQKIELLSTIRPSFNVNVASNKKTIKAFKQSSQLKSQIESLPIISNEKKNITASITTKRYKLNTKLKLIFKYL